MYSFEQLRPHLFTDHGRRVLAAVIEHARHLSGPDSQPFRAESVISAGVHAEPLLVLAALDHLVEIGQLRALDTADEVGLRWRSFALVRT